MDHCRQLSRVNIFCNLAELLNRQLNYSALQKITMNLASKFTILSFFWIFEEKQNVLIAKICQSSVGLDLMDRGISIYWE